jgi:hypothetical protein
MSMNPIHKKNLLTDTEPAKMHVFDPPKAYPQLMPRADQGKLSRSWKVCGKEIRSRGTLIRMAFVEGEGFQFLEDPGAAIDVLRKSKVRFDLFTFKQRISDGSPQYDYPMEMDNMAVIRISTYDDWLNKQINFKVRNKIRKAEKSRVVVRELPFDDELIRGIHGVYNSSPVRQGKRFKHYGIDIESLRGMKSTFLDRSIFIGAFFEGSMIGFIKLVADESWSQAGLMHIVSIIQHRDKAPTNALVAQAVRSCAERGIPYLFYDNFSYGQKEESSLSDFKRHNGFQKVEIPRYYIPLTAVGRMALRLGLHRGILDWVPAPIGATYRRIRRLWYARKMPPGSQNE